MKKIDYQVGLIPSISALDELYQDAKWQAYTANRSLLKKAVERSLLVVTAWENNTLVGLIRCVGDGCTICYVQDILVLSTHRRQGIGRTLLAMVFERFAGVRQKILLCNDDADTRLFYEACGLLSCEQMGCLAYYLPNKAKTG